MYSLIVSGTTTVLGNIGTSVREYVCTEHVREEATYLNIEGIRGAPVSEH